MRHEVFAVSLTCLFRNASRGKRGASSSDDVRLVELEAAPSKMEHILYLYAFRRGLRFGRLLGVGVKIPMYDCVHIPAVVDLSVDSATLPPARPHSLQGIMGVSALSFWFFFRPWEPLQNST
jgi:hypothetical protein